MTAPVEDDLQKLLRRIEAENPEVREGREDLRELHVIIDALIAHRKAVGLSQKDIATVMGVKQSTVSQFETESSDPKLSTLQRYARAVGTRLRATVVPKHVKVLDAYGVAICKTCTEAEARFVGDIQVSMYWAEGDCPGDGIEK